MDTRLTATRGACRSLLATVMALALLMTLAATPAAAASPTACRVQNTETGKTHDALQAAVDAASKGARLTVKGTCHGTTVLDKGVVIEGVRTTTRPLLAGGHEGIVLTVRKGVTATVNGLAIEGGRGQFRDGGPEKPYNWPAGVLNNGNLTLRSVTVKGNRGIGIENTGRLRLNGNAIVRENGFESVNEYTGIHNTGTLRMNGTASARSPDTVKNDGILVMNGASHIEYLTNRGTATLHGTSSAHSVWNRSALILGDQSRIDGRWTGAPMGPVTVYNYGILTLSDTSGIVRSLTGVINMVGSTVILDGQSFISHNSMGVRNHGTVTLNGSSSIRDNHVTKPYRCPCGCTPIGGGGVHNSGTLVLNDFSSIRGNSVPAWSAGSYGGGVYMVRDASLPEPPSLTMTGSSTINGNAAGGPGGGVYAGTGSVLVGVMCGSQSYANVYGNTPDDCYIEP